MGGLAPLWRRHCQEQGLTKLRPWLNNTSTPPPLRRKAPRPLAKAIQGPFWGSSRGLSGLGGRSCKMNNGRRRPFVAAPTPGIKGGKVSEAQLERSRSKPGASTSPSEKLIGNSSIPSPHGSNPPRTKVREPCRSRTSRQATPHTSRPGVPQAHANTQTQQSLALREPHRTCTGCAGMPRGSENWQTSAHSLNSECSSGMAAAIFTVFGRNVPSRLCGIQSNED